MMKIGDRLGGIFGYRGVWWGYEVFGCWVTRIYVRGKSAAGETIVDR